MKVDIYIEVVPFNKNVDSLVRVLQRMEALGRLVSPRHDGIRNESRRAWRQFESRLRRIDMR